MTYTNQINFLSLTSFCYLTLILTCINRTEKFPMTSVFLFLLTSSVISALWILLPCDFMHSYSFTILFSLCNAFSSIITFPSLSHLMVFVLNFLFFEGKLTVLAFFWLCLSGTHWPFFSVSTFMIYLLPEIYCFYFFKFLWAMLLLNSRFGCAFWCNVKII